VGVREIFKFRKGGLMLEKVWNSRCRIQIEVVEHIIDMEVTERSAVQVQVIELAGMHTSGADSGTWKLVRVNQFHSTDLSQAAN
jgi:hypothetical protein